MSDQLNDSSGDWEEAMAEQAAAESESDMVGSTDTDWGDALAEQSAKKENVLGIKPELEKLSADDGEGPSIEDASLDVILDIPVTISLEVGNTKISIRNLLKLNQGSVVELDRLAGEPLDVLVNGTLIAHAEVVVVNERYGIRLTDVISAAERIQKLK